MSNPQDPTVVKKSRYIWLIILSVIVQIVVGFMFSDPEAANALILVRFTFLFVIGFSLSEILNLSFQPTGALKFVFHILALIIIGGLFVVNSNPSIGTIIASIGVIGYGYAWYYLKKLNPDSDQDSGESS